MLPGPVKVMGPVYSRGPAPDRNTNQLRLLGVWCPVHLGRRRLTC